MVKVVNSSFGKRLRRLRKNAGLSQYELAGQIGFRSEKSIRRLEGGVYLPTVETRVRLATVFGITVDDLMGGDVLTGTAEVVRRLKPYVIAHIATIGRKTQELQDQILSLRLRPVWDSHNRHQIEVLQNELEGNVRYIAKVWGDLKELGGG